MAKSHSSHMSFTDLLEGHTKLLKGEMEFVNVLFNTVYS